MKKDTSLQQRAFSWSNKGKLLSAFELGLFMGGMSFLLFPLFVELFGTTSQKGTQLPTLKLFLSIVGLIWGAALGGLSGITFLSHKLFPVNENCIRRYKEYIRKGLELRIQNNLQDIEGMKKEIERRQERIIDLRKEIKEYI